MAWTPQYQQRPMQQPQQQAQQMPQYQNPMANWQQTYQNSQWARPMPQQMPQQGYQQQPQYQQNPYQRQMLQQMPQQYQQQQMPQFSQQQINSFLNYMQSRPMSNFMADPRYQAQESKPAPYTPTQQPAVTPRTYIPAIKETYSGGGMLPSHVSSYSVGDDAADAWVKQKILERNIKLNKETGRGVSASKADYQNFYNQYYSGAQ